MIQTSFALAVAISCLLVTSLLYVCTIPPHLKGWPLRRRCMPPGPRGSFFYGSLFDWLRVRNDGKSMVPWLVEQAKYGEMTTIHLGTKTWVLLNTSRVVDEIIVKRAIITHERPSFPIAGGLVSRNKRFFLHKTKDWKEGRQLLHRLMTGPESKNFGVLVENESVKLLHNCLETPKAWYAHTYRYPIGLIYQIVTGTPLDKTGDDLNDLQRVTSTFLTSINSSLIEFFPVLDRLPHVLQTWRKHWEGIGAFNNRVFRGWWKAMDKVKLAEAEPSFVRDSILPNFEGRDEDAMYLTMLAMSAGGDNPRMTLNTWFMSCLSAPEKLVLMQQELDRICGERAGRLPTLEDLPNCPFTAAVVKEVLRWRPTVPLIPQRVLVKDLEFEGYDFPAGTEFLVNSIPVCNSGYVHSGQYRPERWLEADDSKEQKSGVTQDLWAYAFSGGRRMCVGYKLAQKELFVAIARLAYCFDVESAGPFNDRVLNAFSPGEPFPIALTARTTAHADLIRTAVANL